MSLYNWMLLGYLLFVTLNVIDLFLTKVILENGGKEWNFIAWLKLVILSWFGIQCYFKVLDLYVIFYLNFTFAVVLYFMYKDAIQAGLKEKINPFSRNR